MSMIFVFGSNLAGRHGKGAALTARKHHGAVYGQGQGRQGNSYAIPTKDSNLSSLPLSDIKEHVNTFIEYANANKGLSFYVTPIGTGLAGHSIEDIRELFMSDPLRNCIFRDENSTEWRLP